MLRHVGLLVVVILVFSELLGSVFWCLTLTSQSLLFQIPQLRLFLSPSKAFLISAVLLFCFLLQYFRSLAFLYSFLEFHLSASMRVYVPTKLLQSRLTLCDPMDCSPPGFSVHGILQAGILEWVAMLSSRGSSRPRDGTSIF